MHPFWSTTPAPLQQSRFANLRTVHGNHSNISLHTWLDTVWAATNLLLANRQSFFMFFLAKCLSTWILLQVAIYHQCALAVTSSQSFGPASRTVFQSTFHSPAIKDAIFSLCSRDHQYISRQSDGPKLIKKHGPLEYNIMSQPNHTPNVCRKLGDAVQLQDAINFLKYNVDSTVFHGMAYGLC